jgi:hypothetical protein
LPWRTFRVLGNAFISPGHQELSCSQSHSPHFLLALSNMCWFCWSMDVQCQKTMYQHVGCPRENVWDYACQVLSTFKKNLISFRNVTLFWNIESWGTGMISPLQKVIEIWYLLQYIQQNSRQQWTKSLIAPIWSSVPVLEINCICRATDLYSMNWAMLDNIFDSATIIQPVLLWVPSWEPDISALKLHATL